MLKKIESRTIAGIEIIALEYVMETPRGEVHGSFFTGYVQLASQNLCRISTYVVASYRPHLCPLLGKTDHKKLFHSYHQNSHVCIEKHQNETTITKRPKLA